MKLTCKKTSFYEEFDNFFKNLGPKKRLKRESFNSINLSKYTEKKNA